jgi:hypothetical protein
MSSNLTDQTSSLGEKTNSHSAQSARSSRSNPRSRKQSFGPAQIQPSSNSHLEPATGPEVPQPVSTQRSDSKSCLAYISVTPTKTTTNRSGSSSSMLNPPPDMKSQAGFIKEEDFSRARSKRRRVRRSRAREEDFRYELQRMQDGNMSCQLCRRYVRCAEATDGEYSVRCCFSCARKWSVETSKKVNYYELTRDRIFEIDQHTHKIINKNPIIITPTSNPYSLFMSLNKNGMLKMLGVSKQKWSELDDPKRKMYELLLKLMTGEQDSE